MAEPKITGAELDRQLAIEASRFAGLTGERWQGMVHLFELVRADERKRVLDEVRHFDEFVAAEVEDSLAKRTGHV